MSRMRYRFGVDIQPYFMTETIVAWLPVFSYPEYATIVLDSWRFLQREREITIFAWVILENHVHWIASGPQLSKRVAEFKSFTATSILKRMEERGAKTLLKELTHYKLPHKTSQRHQFWQEGSHPQVIESDEVMWQKVEYIHNNPLRRGYVDAGANGLIDVCVDWR
jgi:putative transposase